MSNHYTRVSASPVSGVGTPYRSIAQLVHDKMQIEAFAAAADISSRKVVRDSCEQWSIIGKTGTVQAYDDARYLLYVRARSSRIWGAIKRKALSLGWTLTQDGDAEGCFNLALPNDQSASYLRSLLSLRKRRLDKQRKAS